MKMTIEKTAEERRTPDFRHQECKHWHYNEHLPMVSIIIIFQNEDYSGRFSNLQAGIRTAVWNQFEILSEL